MDIIKGMYFLKELLKDDVYIIEENKRYPLLVLVDDNNSPYLNEKDEEFLEKILQSVGIKLSEVRLINTAQEGIEENYDNLQELPSSRVISFGVNLNVLNFDITLNKYSLKTQESIVFLLADTLGEISSDQNRKKQLWQALKQLFHEHFN